MAVKLPKHVLKTLSYVSHARPVSPIIVPNYKKARSEKLEEEARIRRHNLMNYHRGRVNVETSGDLPQGNIPLGMYRYFVGSESQTGIWARCRACQMDVMVNMSKLTRDEKNMSRLALMASRLTHHMRNERLWFRDGCASATSKAIPLLLADQLCVMCDEELLNKDDGKWGIPLCSKACTIKWMFHPVKNIRLEEAIDLAIARNMIVMNGENHGKTMEDYLASHRPAFD